jgi:hypothetical protein
MMYHGTTKTSNPPTWTGWPRAASSWRTTMSSLFVHPPGFSVIKLFDFANGSCEDKLGWLLLQFFKQNIQIFVIKTYP